MDDVKIGEILEPGDESRFRKRSERVKQGFWKAVRRAGRMVPFMDEVVAAYYCALDQKTPMRVRMTLMAALAYFVLPFDAIPDILAGIGFTDDVAVLMAALTAVRAHITPAHRLAARQALEDEAAVGQWGSAVGQWGSEKYGRCGYVQPKHTPPLPYSPIPLTYCLIP
ncbi:Hypothetical protein BSPT2_I0076 [Brucella suis bv. 2]|nr:Hypothetical protein BSPT2_I0076 [Brucella suis bv. 2]